MPGPVASRHATLDIDSLDMEARGVGRALDAEGQPGKVIFVEGALPGERVTYVSHRKKSRFELAEVVDVLRESASRTVPRCRFFGTCGGCSMQHLDLRAQVAVKQRVLEDSFRHLAKLRPETIFRPLHGLAWGYRHRARLAVHDFAGEGVRIGFHERKTRNIADLSSCDVLPPRVSALLMPLRHLVDALSIHARLPQIELAVAGGAIALALRVLQPLTQADETLLRDFADLHGVQFWLQPEGPQTLVPFYPASAELAYTLPEFGIRIAYRPNDFTQVNEQVNRVLVGRALRLLAPAWGDRVLDLFCGLGNFTLPLACLAREVVGIEGSSTLTGRAQENAAANGLQAKTSFMCRNLFEISAKDLRALGPFEKYLIDPPREGALAVAQALADMAHSRGTPPPGRIVYVSCNPATLARDAELLVHQAGYRLRGAGVINMFPHTSHVESIALFTRG